jgi:hypothetical protein
MLPGSMLPEASVEFSITADPRSMLNADTHRVVESEEIGGDRRRSEEIDQLEINWHGCYTRADVF